jgi:hypothetical protein
VTARGANITVVYTANVSSNNTWTVEAPLDFTPVSFIVTLTDTAEVTYRSKAYTPATVTEGTNIALIVNCTTEVGKAVFSPGDLQHFADDPTASYSMADDVALPSDWTGGPENYSGNFYGNGYTISNLTFSEVKDRMGLFKSLGTNAQIHDLTIEVPYTTDPIPLTATGGNTYFGAVVGFTSAQNVLIRGVTVKGGLHLEQQSPRNLVCGGFFGEVSTDADVIFQKCVSDMRIVIDKTAQLSTANADGTLVGGFVGLVYKSNASFTDCYSTGKIDTKFIQETFIYFGGVVIGGFVAKGELGGTTINNCYSSTEIDSKVYIVNSATTKGNTVGGFVGYIDNQPTTIINTLALNPHIRAVNGTFYDGPGRVIGRLGTANPALSGLYALESMELTADGNDVVLTDAAANGKNGLGATEAVLRNKAFWTGTLVWSADIWDFSPLTADVPGWPTLR